MADSDKTTSVGFQCTPAQRESYIKAANEEVKEVNLSNLIGHCVSSELLKTARLDSEWGCLEFNNGMIDIEPKTLYRFTQT